MLSKHHSEMRQETFDLSHVWSSSFNTRLYTPINSGHRLLHAGLVSSRLPYLTSMNEDVLVDPDYATEPEEVVQRLTRQRGSFNV